MISPAWYELVAAIGEAATERLVDAHGGVRLYIPHQVTGHHPLRELLGVAAEGLARTWPGETIELPTAEARQRRHRWERIAEASRTGRSVREIARQEGMPLRSIKRIRARLRDPDTPDDRRAGWPDARQQQLDI